MIMAISNAHGMNISKNDPKSLAKTSKYSSNFYFSTNWIVQLDEAGKNEQASTITLDI